MSSLTRLFPSFYARLRADTVDEISPAFSGGFRLVICKVCVLEEGREVFGGGLIFAETWLRLKFLVVLELSFLSALNFGEIVLWLIGPRVAE